MDVSPSLSLPSSLSLKAIFFFKFNFCPGLVLHIQYILKTVRTEDSANRSSVLKAGLLKVLEQGLAICGP